MTGHVEGYRLDAVAPLDGLGGECRSLTHLATGARHVHVACPDDNRAFAVLVPTPPEDSRGAAHVLEHLVGCGSARFPVPNAFVAMMHRSLRTFLNAVTGADASWFTFSTRHPTDFGHLLDVVVDAVFFPLLDPLSFLQEAHRLEASDPADPASPLVRRGVVLSELLASEAVPAEHLRAALGAALFPSTPYEHRAGGTVAGLVELTVDDVVAYHQRHFHPSASLFFTYGDIPLDAVLARLGAALAPLGRREPAPVEEPRALPSPRRHPVAIPGNNQLGVLAWATAPVADTGAVLALRSLHQATTAQGGPVAAVLGGGPSPGTGVYTDHARAVFAVGLRAAGDGGVDAMAEAVLGAVERLPARDLLDAAAGAVERSVRSLANEPFPGLPCAQRQFLRMAGPWLHGADPLAALVPDADLAVLRRHVGDPDWVAAELVRPWLVANRHRALVLGMPGLEPPSSAVPAVDIAERRRLVDQAASLATHRRSGAAADVLPRLRRRDLVPDRPGPPDGDVRAHAGADLVLVPARTNGLVHLHLRLPVDRPAAVAGVAAAILRERAGEAGALALGEVDVAAVVRRPPAEGPACRHLRLSVTALPRHLPRLVDALAAVLPGPPRAPERLPAQARSAAAARTRAARGREAVAAMLLAAAGLDDVTTLDARWSGTFAGDLLRAIALPGPVDVGAAAAAVDHVVGAAAATPGARVCVVAEAADLRAAGAAVSGLAAGLGVGVAPGPPPAVPLPRHDPVRPVPGALATNALVVAAPGYADRDAPAAQVLAEVLRARLFTSVRAGGGAYAAGAVFEPEKGWLGCWSSDDPGIGATFGAFRAAVDELVAAPVDGDELERAVVAAHGTANPLPSVDRSPADSWFDADDGYGPAVRAQFRTRLLDVTASDVHRVAGALAAAGRWRAACLVPRPRLDEARAAVAAAAG